jgi:hypothetical protein
MTWDDTKTTEDGDGTVDADEQLTASEWNDHVGDGHFPSDKLNLGTDSNGDPVMTDPANGDQVVLRYDPGAGQWEIVNVNLELNSNDVTGVGLIDTSEINNIEFVDPGTSDIGAAINDIISNTSAGTQIIAPEPTGDAYTQETQINIPSGYHVGSLVDSHWRLGSRTPTFPEFEVASAGPSPAITIEGDASFTDIYISSRGQGVRSSGGGCKVRVVVDKVEDYGIKHVDTNPDGTGTNSNIAHIECSVEGNGDFDSRGVVVEGNDPTNSNGPKVICHDMLFLRRDVHVIRSIGGQYEIQHSDQAGQTFSSGDKKVVECDAASGNLFRDLYCDGADVLVDEINGAGDNQYLVSNPGGATTNYSPPASLGSNRDASRLIAEGLREPRVGGVFTLTADQSINADDPTTVAYDTVDEGDDYGALDTATGEYTAPSAGVYDIHAQVETSDATDGDSLRLAVMINGSRKRRRQDTYSGAMSHDVTADGIELSEGDTIAIRFENTTSSCTLSGLGDRSYFEVEHKF